MNKDGRAKDGKWLKGRKMPQEEKEKIAEALVGNTNKIKIKDDEVLQAAYDAYCGYIASGRGQRGFVFDYETEEGKKGFVTWQTLENYLKDPRFDLDPSKKTRAENVAYQAWENSGIDMMQGKFEKCQPAIYQMMMRNKFGWDKESKVSHYHEADAKRFMKYCDSAPVEKTDEPVSEGN